MRNALLLAALLAALQAQSPAPREIDGARSRAQFSVAHIWVERVTGTVPILSGTATLAAGSAIPAHVSAVLDATKIATGEPDRDGQLESPDFFDAKRFPTWKFESTEIVPDGTRSFDMEGLLTIHGVTQPERMTVAVGGTAEHPTYHATAHIDRHAFGMATTRLDPTIGNVVDVTLDVTLK